MRKALEEKDTQISGLEIRLDELENKFKEEKKGKDRKIKELESLLKNNQNKKTKMPENFKCSECDYETTTMKGMKTHKTRKHTKTSKLKYPINCDLCDEKLDDEKEMRLHMKGHAYFEAKFRCEDCDYWSQNYLTMELHVGKNHSESVECGLCDYKADNLNTLKIHHATCEIYECDNCYFRVTTLSEMKKHLQKKHKEEDDVKVIHGKINRKDEDEVDEVEYMQSEL